MAMQLRSRRQINEMREAGRLVGKTFEYLRPYIRPGVTTLELDQLAEEFIRKHGGIPAYKGYAPRGVPPFPATICVAPNDVICHGIPDKTTLKDGDIIGIDIGAKLNGWYGDSCVTFAVGNISPEAAKLMKVAEECMWLGIEQAKANAHLGDIGAAIQEHAHANGFSVVREWTGHGVGERLHEDPTVPHYGKAGTGVRLRPGLIFTVEPMINIGGYATKVDRRDQWTVRTVDGSLSAQFEHAIVVTDSGEPEILTLP